jgi:allantoate deiminase
MEVDIARIRKDIEIINSFNSTPGNGITRLSFTPEYMGAYHYIINELRNIGAEVTICRGGCIRGRLTGSDPSKPAIMSGSHIDTVLNGGQFDGQLGSVAALEVTRIIVEKKVSHSHAIDVVIFPEEEGVRFGMAMASSSAWAGISDPENLYQSKDKNGVTYQEAMDVAGIIIDDIFPLEKGMIKAMLEIHIEQSVVLDQKGISVGIIESIAGARLYDVILEGQVNHAGGTPMSYRADALQGAARVITELEDIASNRIGANTVGTCGTLNISPGAMNVIPGRVDMTLDLRDSEDENLDMMSLKIKTYAEKICEDRNLKLIMNERFRVHPTQIPEYLINLLSDCANQRKIKSRKMMSGALHDSCKMASITDIGMLFVPSKDGRSHCPEEWTDFEHIELATNVLLDAVVQLAK